MYGFVKYDSFVCGFYYAAKSKAPRKLNRLMPDSRNRLKTFPRQSCSRLCRPQNDCGYGPQNRCCWHSSSGRWSNSCLHLAEWLRNYFVSQQLALTSGMETMVKSVSMRKLMTNLLLGYHVFVRFLFCVYSMTHCR